MEVNDLQSARDLNFRVEHPNIDLCANFYLPSYNRDFNMPDINFPCKSSLNAPPPFSQKTGKISILHSKFADFFTVNFVDFSSRTRQSYFHVRFIRIYSLRLNLPIFTIIGRSPKTPDSGRAARGQRRSGQLYIFYGYKSSIF